MAPRTIVYTGKGGVGKTSVAAATARRCAAGGQRTIVLSTDPAHSLSDSLGVRLGGEPMQVGERLWGQEVAAQDELERNWSAVQEWLGEILVERGVDRISAEELTVPPGLDELFSLLALRRHHESEDYEVIVVDCAPTGETLRLLSFPDVARWWLRRSSRPQNQLLAAARPFARAMLDISLPGEAVLDDVNRLVANLIAMNQILRDHERVSIRLVTNPDRMVIDESRRTFTYLNLYGFLTDAVIVNRVFPADGRPVLRGLARAPAGAARRRRWPPSPPSPCCALRTSSRGPGPGDARPARRGPLRRSRRGRRPPPAPGATSSRSASSSATLRLDLPFAEKGAISLKKVGLELIVRVDGQKRTIILPPGLARFRPAGAAFADGALEVSFVEAPAGAASPIRSAACATRSGWPPRPPSVSSPMRGPRAGRGGGSEVAVGTSTVWSGFACIPLDLLCCRRLDGPAWRCDPRWRGCDALGRLGPGRRSPRVGARAGTAWLVPG